MQSCVGRRARLLEALSNIRCGRLVCHQELASEMRDASDGDRATSQTAEGARSGGADGATSWQWQFVVARDDEVVNAFCMVRLLLRKHGCTFIS